MSRGRLFVAVLALLGSLVSPAPARADAPTDAAILDQAASPPWVTRRLKRYAPVHLGVGPGTIPEALRPMLAPLRQAADGMDRIFWQQMSPEGWAMLQTLRSSSRKASQDLAKLLQIQYGPWDRHADDAPFIGQHARPAGAAFYPRDISRRELDAWIEAHPDALPALWSPYTVIVRGQSGLEPVPYSKTWSDPLLDAASHLQAAAAAYVCDGADCPCRGFARFLVARAKSFADDDYRTSEVQWLQTGDCPLDAAIGPYEYYEDRLLGLKTAFGAVIYFRDQAESKRYAKLLDQLGGLLENLPLSPELRDRYQAVPPSPITIADVLYTAGEAHAGFQVRAFILPNDEVVQREHGTKNVILRNVVRAKFDRLAHPVAERIFDGALSAKVTFDSYFEFLLAWQLAHAMAPRAFEDARGTRTTPRQQLLGRHSYMDALKGEVVALLNTFYLSDKHAIRAQSDEEVLATYLAGLFDSVRLASGTPQTVARTIVYNFLAREWAVRYSPATRRFEVNPPAIRGAVRRLAQETLEILGRGDYDGAGRLIVQFGIMPGEMREKLGELDDLPFDILPTYTTMAASPSDT